MKKTRTIGFCLLLLGILWGILAWCCHLPSNEGRAESSALLDTGATALGRAITPRVAEHPGQSGFRSLLDSREAFAARMRLAATAERTLDIQYYIWRHDTSGTLLFQALRAAAERGVRVRLLLDDNNTAGLDATLAALDSHPNIEVRLFNPFVVRWPRLLGYLTDFSRLNRRMHNKSFTADNQATIIGGRNVGDEYFGVTGMLFVDLDILAVGPVVGEVSRDFDRYWASGSSYPASRVLPTADPQGLGHLAAAAARLVREPVAAQYIRATSDSTFVRQLIGGELALEWAPIRMVSDDPAKGLGRAVESTFLPRQLRHMLGKPVHKLELVSPYFVPTRTGLDWFRGLARNGVKIRVLTNSLEATDVSAVHAGYAKHRVALLESNIALYEMKRIAVAPAGRDRRMFSSSGSSLHAKIFSVDRARVFIGSFNFDPRSIALNTEMGFILESPALAQRIETVFDREIPAVAYELRSPVKGSVEWIERRAGAPVSHDTEPGTPVWRRAWVRFLSWLPIEWLL